MLMNAQYLQYVNQYKKKRLISTIRNSGITDNASSALKGKNYSYSLKLNLNALLNIILLYTSKMSIQYIEKQKKKSNYLSKYLY